MPNSAASTSEPSWRGTVVFRRRKFSGQKRKGMTKVKQTDKRRSRGVRDSSKVGFLIEAAASFFFFLLLKSL